MKKQDLLRAVVILQAVCMVALAIVVIARVWPVSSLTPGEAPAPEDGGSRDDTGSQRPKPGSDGQDTTAEGTPLGSGEDTVIARIGDEVITVAQLQKLLLEQHGEVALQQLMLRKAIDLEASQMGMEVDESRVRLELAERMAAYESEEQFYRVMQQQLGMSQEQVLLDLRYKVLLEQLATADLVVTSEEIEEYLNKNPERFTSQQKLELRWILLDDAEEAERVKGYLNGGKDFGELAQEYSKDTYTAVGGGYAGWIDGTDPFYDENLLGSAAALQVGELSEPLQTDRGYVIVQLLQEKWTPSVTGEALRDQAKLQLLLEQARPLADVEEELLEKHKASIENSEVLLR